MDPGYKLIQHLKTVPNLVNEDPSTITPTNTAFMDMPWKEFSRNLEKHRETKRMSREVTDETLKQPEEGSVQEGSAEDFSLGNWDASTGYQDTDHRNSSHINRNKGPAEK